MNKPDILTDEQIMRAIWESEYKSSNWDIFKHGNLKKYERDLCRAQRDDTFEKTRRETLKMVFQILEDYGSGDKGGITWIEFGEKYHLDSRDLSLVAMIEYILTN